MTERVNKGCCGQGDSAGRGILSIKYLQMESAFSFTPGLSKTVKLTPF